jgi:hypothetical protein
MDNNHAGDDPAAERPVEHEHAHVARQAATPRWRGERLDRAYAVSVLAGRRELLAARLVASG